MELNSFTLFAANAIILLVMAVVFRVAGHGRQHETYWTSWCLANVLLGAALVVFLIERQLPSLMVAILPNALLVIGFGVRWRAAREFSGRSAPKHLVWGPALVFSALCCLPWLSGSYGPVYTIVNTMLAALAFAVAWEFWRDREDGLPSRYGLVLSYAVMSASFAFRIGQGILYGEDMEYFLPHDTLLAIHLVIAVFHTVSSGGFALSIAYERIAAGLGRAATHDFLTGLANRGGFEAWLRAHLDKPGSKPFALVLLDLDHFKRINDRYGHATGDAALRTCASLFRDCLRERGFVGRIGGEEFGAVLIDVTPDEARVLTERLRQIVGAMTMEFADRQFQVTISAGLCHSSACERDFDMMMSTADAALYAAKHKGRDRVESVAA